MLMQNMNNLNQHLTRLPSVDIESKLNQAVKKLAFAPLQFTVSFNFSRQDFRPVERWVSEVYPQAACLFSAEYHLTHKAQETDADMQALQQYAHCICVMSLLFFKQVNLPVFEPPEVTFDNRLWVENTEVDLVFQLVNTGVVAVQLLKEVFSAALQMCNWLAVQPVAGKTLKQDGLEFFQHLTTTRFSSKNSNSPSTMKLLEEAYKAGIHYCHLGKGVYRLGWGKHASLFLASIAQTDSYSGMRLTGDKQCTAKLLSAAGIAVPVHKAVKNLATAIQACKSLGFPVVIKPVDSERGEGVSVDLTDELSIPLAFEKALRFSKAKSVLVERQVAGVCHRLFMVNGRLLYAVKRWPPSVFGDGVSGIRQLVEANVLSELAKLPFERHPLVFWDAETEDFIQQLGLNADYVPVSLERIPLRRIESTQWGGFDENVTTQVHPDTLRQARMACQLVQLSVVGVDVITEDISLPLSQTGGVINELNGGPSLGGAEISRSYIPEYLRRLVPGHGKIAIEVFAEAELEKAICSFRQQREMGIQCYFVSDSLVIDHQGEEILNKHSSLAEQLRILIFNPDVEALCIVSGELK